MGVLSLYKVFRNNTGQKKKEKGKEGKAGRERKDSGKKKRKRREEKRREEQAEKEKEEKASIGEKEGRKRPIKEARDYSYYKEEVRGKCQ